MSYKLLLILILNINSSKGALKSGIQITSGIGGGIFTTLMLYEILPVYHISGDVMKIDAQLLIFDTALGLTLGSSLGIIISGKVMKVEGSNSGAILGSLLGFFAGGLSFALLSETLKGKSYENLSVLPLFTFPSIGGFIGYHVLKNKKEKILKTE